MPFPPKATLLAEVRATLQTTLGDLQREADAARAGTRVDGTHRPENRGERAAVTSQGYLAGALSARLAELSEQLRLLELVAPGPRERAAVGALVRVLDPDEQEHAYLIAPGAAGRPLDAAPEVVAVSPASPIGRALVGARPGDLVLAARGADEVELEVLDVQ